MQNKTPLNYSELSPSLHNDLCDVINTMGPPTPLLPLDSEFEDTTISSNYTQSSISDGTNTSFVEVIIKNHHKSKKLKVLEEDRKKITDKIINLDTDSLSVEHEGPRKSSNDESMEMNENFPSHHVPKSNNAQSTNISCPHFTYPCQPCVLAPNIEGFSSKYFQDYKAQKSDEVIPENNIHKKNLIDPNKTRKKFHTNTDKQSKRQTKTNENQILRGIPNIEIINDGKEDELMKNRKHTVSKCHLCSETRQGLMHPQGLMERTELYYFDHGNSSYYHTTDSPPVIFADYLAEKTENAATRFWAKIFGMANVVISLITSFILQSTRFILFSLVRPLTVGLLQIYSDYFLKPFLSVIFNAFIQPPLIFIFNIITSLRDLCEPIAQSFGFFLREVANVLRAFRLVEYNNNNFSKESHV